VMAGKMGLDAVAARVLQNNTDTRPVSGRQENLENLLNSFI
jgi:xylose isomerase